MKTLHVIVNKNGGTAAKMGDALIGELEKSFAEAGATAQVAALDGSKSPTQSRWQRHRDG